MSEDPFFSRNNINAILQIVRNQTNKTLGIDISTDQRWQGEINNIMRKIYNNQAQYGINQNSQPNDRLRILSQKVIQVAVGYIQNEFQKTRPQMTSRTTFTQQSTPQQRVTQPTVFEQQSSLGQQNNNNPYGNSIESMNTKLGQSVNKSFENISKQREMIEQRPGPVNFQDANLEKNNTDIQKNYEELLRNRNNINIPTTPQTSLPSSNQNIISDFNSSKINEISSTSSNNEPEYLSFFTNTTISEPMSLQSNNQQSMNGDNMNFQDLMKNSANELEQSFNKKDTQSLTYNPNIIQSNQPIQTTQSIQPTQPIINQPNIQSITYQPTIQPVTQPQLQTTVTYNAPAEYRKKTKTKILYFNTQFRPNYTSSKSTDYIQPIMYPLKNILSARLVSVELPTLLYQFSHTNNNNIFIYSINSVNHTVKIPDGTYSLYDFVNMINELPDIKNNLHFSIDNYSNRTTIKSINDTPFTLNFTIGNSEYERNFGWILGFRNMLYQENSVYTSEGIYMHNKNHNFYFIMNDYNTLVSEQIVALLQNGYIDQNVFGRIIVSSNGETTLMNNETKKREYGEPISINKIAIKLMNEYGEVANLNNMDFTYGIEFEMVE
jgi:hypothetical protein